MAINNFIPFAVSNGANVTSQDDYEALAALSTGFASGKASSAQINKALRQGTVIASVLAQFIADNSGNDVLDDGDTLTLADNFLQAIKAVGANDFLAKTNYLSEIAAAGHAGDALANLGVTALLNLKAPLISPALTGTPTAPTPAQGTNSTVIATTAFVQSIISSLSIPKNSASLAQNGWWKCGDTGLITQWGFTGSSSYGFYYTTFPITFPHAVFSIVETIVRPDSGGATDWTIIHSNPTTSGFFGGADQYGYYWKAIGY